MVKDQPIDARHEIAGEMLGLPPRQIAVQFGLIWPDRLYAWDEPKGRTVIVDSELHSMEFAPGVLLQMALGQFEENYPVKEEAQRN